MEKKTLAIIAMALCTISVSIAQENKKKVVDANELYADSAFIKASEIYTSVDPSSEYKGQANYNAANALYKADSLDKAIELLQNQAQLFADKEDKARSFHNLGNAQLKAGKLEDAVKAYKEALKNNPSDEETRYNYTKAKKMLEQQKQEQKDKPEDKKDEKKEEQDKKDQKQEEDKKQEDDQKKDEQQSKEEQEQQQQEQQQKQQQAAASKKQAEQMLNALNQEEKGIQKKVKKQKGKGTKIKIEKDW
jgi:tetratricopeptide (TPR) repeat protein